MSHLNLIDKACLLKKTHLFGELDLDLLLAISDKMGELTFEANTPIFHLNQMASRMYVIVSGAVVIQDEHKKALAHLSEGDFFGDEALFNEKSRTYEALSQESTLVLTLSRTNLLTIMSECPSVAIALLRLYAAPLLFRAR